MNRLSILLVVAFALIALEAGSPQDANGAPATSGAATGPSRPTAAQIQQRIAKIRQITDAIRADGGYSDPYFPKEGDVGQSIARRLDLLDKTNADDISGAIVVAKTIYDGRNGERSIDEMIDFCISIGRFNIAGRLAVDGLSEEAKINALQKVAIAAVDSGDKSAARSSVDAAISQLHKRGSAPASAEVRQDVDRQVKSFSAIMDQKPIASGINVPEWMNRLHGFVEHKAEASLAEERPRVRAWVDSLADEKDPLALSAAAEMLMAVGERAEAGKMLDRAEAAIKASTALTRLPVNRALIMRIATLRASTGLPGAVEAAMLAIKPVSKGQPNSARDVINLAHIALAAGDKAGAASAVRAALDAGAIESVEPPADIGALIELGGLLAPGDPARGAALFDRAAERHARLADGRDRLPDPMNRQPRPPGGPNPAPAKPAPPAPGSPETPFEAQARQDFFEARPEGLLKIATAEHNAGLTAASEKRFAEAVALACAVPVVAAPQYNDPATAALMTAGDRKAEWGDIDAAVALYEQAAARDAKDLPNASPQLPPPSIRAADIALFKIVQLRLSQNRVPDALAAARRMRTADASYARLFIGQRMVKNGDIDSAMKLAAEFPATGSGSDTTRKATLLASIAQARAAKGDKPGVAAILAELTPLTAQGGSTELNDQVNKAIDALTDAGDVEGAIAALQRAYPRYPGQRNPGTRHAIKVLAAGGKFDAALKLAEAMPTTGDSNALTDKGLALADIAVAQLKAGDRNAFDQTASLACAAAHQDGMDNAFTAIAPLAAALEKAGDRDGARAVRAMAVRRMLSGTNPQAVTMLEHIVVYDIPQQSDIAESLWAARSAPRAPVRNVLLARIALKLIEKLERGEDVPQFQVPPIMPEPK